MAWSIYQVKDIFFALVFIIDLDSMALNSNTLLSFEVHIIKYLVLHISLTDGIGRLQKPVGQGAFTVIDMGDDTKISDVLHVLQLRFEAQN